MGSSCVNSRESDYYTDDDHPNKNGYTKIAACAANVITELAAEDQ